MSEGKREMTADEVRERGARRGQLEADVRVRLEELYPASSLTCAKCDGEPKPAKVVIVTDCTGGTHRYRADDWNGDSSGLDVLRNGRTVATYPGEHSWLCARIDGAEVPDGTQRALGIAKQALSDICDMGAPGEDAHDRAHKALDEIFAETEL